MQSLLLNKNNFEVTKPQDPSASDTKSNRVFYLVTANLLTISINGKTDFVTKSHPLFNKLVEFLPRSSEFVIANSTASPSQQLKEAVYDNLTSGVIKDGMVDGIVISDMMSEKIVNLLAQDLPYQPLLKMWAKLQASPYLNQNDKDLLLAAAATVNMPITWDGNLVLYARANMNRNQTVEVLNLTRPTSLLPDGKQDNAPKPNLLKLGQLDRVSSMCTDAGVISDWLVNPAAITELRGNFYSVSAADRISVLAERHTADRSTVSLNSSSLGNLVIRDPHDEATSLAALPHQAAFAHKSAVAKLESAFHSASC